MVFEEMRRNVKRKRERGAMGEMRKTGIRRRMGNWVFVGKGRGRRCVSEGKGNVR